MGADEEVIGGALNDLYALKHVIFHKMLKGRSTSESSIRLLVLRFKVIIVSGCLTQISSWPGPPTGSRGLRACGRLSASAAGFFCQKTHLKSGLETVPQGDGRRNVLRTEFIRQRKQSKQFVSGN